MEIIILSQYNNKIVTVIISNSVLSSIDGSILCKTLLITSLKNIDKFNQTNMQTSQIHTF